MNRLKALLLCFLIIAAAALPRPSAWGIIISNQPSWDDDSPIIINPVTITNTHTIANKDNEWQNTPPTNSVGDAMRKMVISSGGTTTNFYCVVYQDELDYAITNILAGLTLSPTPTAHETASALASIWTALGGTISDSSSNVDATEISE